MTALAAARKALKDLANRELLYTHHGNVCAREEAFEELAKHFEAFAHAPRTNDARDKP